MTVKYKTNHDRTVQDKTKQICTLQTLKGEEERERERGGEGVTGEMREVVH